MLTACWSAASAEPSYTMNGRHTSFDRTRSVTRTVCQWRASIELRMVNPASGFVSSISCTRQPGVHALMKERREDSFCEYTLTDWVEQAVPESRGPWSGPLR